MSATASPRESECQQACEAEGTQRAGHGAFPPKESATLPPPRAGTQCRARERALTGDQPEGQTLRPRTWPEPTGPRALPRPDLALQGRERTGPGQISQAQNELPRPSCCPPGQAQERKPALRSRARRSSLSPVLVPRGPDCSLHVGQMLPDQFLGLRGMADEGTRGGKGCSVQHRKGVRWPRCAHRARCSASPVSASVGPAIVRGLHGSPPVPPAARASGPSRVGRDRLRAEVGPGRATGPVPPQGLRRRVPPCPSIFFKIKPLGTVALPRLKEEAGRLFQPVREETSPAALRWPVCPAAPPSGSYLLLPENLSHVRAGAVCPPRSPGGRTAQHSSRVKTETVGRMASLPWVPPPPQACQTGSSAGCPLPVRSLPDLSGSMCPISTCLHAITPTCLCASLQGPAADSPCGTAPVAGTESAHPDPDAQADPE
ncbi:uncharacterized protein LOC131381646 [Hylobates moloch]|uniref:uncharacterized protein LOC131381646 n=1 Tax=Hylobates moloch TaxID=81572 RepID=UPI0026773997|nr:uncharacterized protein LOC131381646 [Hylobates moloch]